MISSVLHMYVCVWAKAGGVSLEQYTDSSQESNLFPWICWGMRPFTPTIRVMTNLLHSYAESFDTLGESEGLMEEHYNFKETYSVDNELKSSCVEDSPLEDGAPNSGRVNL